MRLKVHQQKIWVRLCSANELDHLHINSSLVKIDNANKCAPRNIQDPITPIISDLCRYFHSHINRTVINVVNRYQRTMIKWSFWNTEWCFRMNITGLSIICPLPGVTISKKMETQIRTIQATNIVRLVSQWDVMFRKMASRRTHVLWVQTIKMQIHSISSITWKLPSIIMKAVKTTSEIDLFKLELFPDRKSQF